MEVENLNTGELIVIRYQGALYRALVTHVHLNVRALPDDPDTADIRIGATVEGYQENPWGDEEQIDNCADVVCKVRLVHYTELPVSGDAYWTRVASHACDWNERMDGDAQWRQVLEKPYKWLCEAWLAGFDFPCERGTLTEVIEAAKEAQV